MRVAVIDVGSNTVRLLVAEETRSGLQPVGEAKAYLRLGAEILRTGGVGEAKLGETEEETRRFATIAHELGAAALDVFVTAPGRQADNADELVATIARATGGLVRVLSAEEEGSLAYEGARETTAVEREPVAVCDVGGGSTEVTVGDLHRGPFWTRSVELGSLRLTAAALPDDPPTPKQLRRARALVEEQFAGIDPPEVTTALAVGGSARALAKLTGRQLGPDELERTLEQIVSRPAAETARAATLDEARAATLAGGAIILLELTRHLAAPLTLAAGGLREGAAARLLAARRAA